MNDRERGPIRSYRDLDVWKHGMDIAELVHRETRAVPKVEVFGMTSQMRRASSSVPYNIAEGWGKDTTAQFIHGLQIAQGSLKELETQVILASRLEYIAKDLEERLLAMLDAEGRMIRALIRSLER